MSSRSRRYAAVNLKSRLELCVLKKSRKSLPEFSMNSRSVSDFSVLRFFVSRNREQDLLRKKSVSRRSAKDFSVNRQNVPSWRDSAASRQIVKNAPE